MNTSTRRARQPARVRCPSADEASEAMFAEHLSNWNRLRLRNHMIEWKRSHRDGTYLDFLRDEMPENVRTNTDGKVIWVDPRVEGSKWRGAFDAVCANDPLLPLPGGAAPPVPAVMPDAGAGASMSTGASARTSYKYISGSPDAGDTAKKDNRQHNIVSRMLNFGQHASAGLLFSQSPLRSPSRSPTPAAPNDIN